MKNMTKIAAGIVAVLVFASEAAYAATASTSAITTSADVSSNLSVTYVLKKNSSAGATITSMDFGTLQNVGTGTLRSSATGSTGTGSAVAFITANSQGAPYTVSQTGTTMSNGSTTLPDGALTVVPVYAAADNGSAAQPAGSSLGTAGTWVATGKTLYASGSGAGASAMPTIQAAYSVTDDPAAGSSASVPLNQPSGTYTGTVTFTVTT